MGNARKNYTNIKRLFSCDILALLNSIQSDDKGDIENTTDISDTEFVGEDESVISTNIIRNEEISDQSSSVSVPEASIHILFTQNEDETDTLDQDEPNPVPATQRTSSNQSPSLATQRTSNQSLLLPLGLLSINHLLLSIKVIPINHLLLPLSVLQISDLLLPLSI